MRSSRAGTVSGERLTDRSVANIVKAYAERAGFDANLFSGHSLRSGFLTSAAAKGASIFKMMDVSRHKSVDTLRGYVRLGPQPDFFKNSISIFPTQGRSASSLYLPSWDLFATSR